MHKCQELSQYSNTEKIKTDMVPILMELIFQWGNRMKFSKTIFKKLYTSYEEMKQENEIESYEDLEERDLQMLYLE